MRARYINSPSYKQRESSFGYRATLLTVAILIWGLLIVAWGLGL